MAAAICFSARKLTLSPGRRGSNLSPCRSRRNFRVLVLARFDQIAKVFQIPPHVPTAD